MTGIGRSWDLSEGIVWSKWNTLVSMRDLSQKLVESDEVR